MLCRALLTAIAISYLICVLFLSGIQKEDLDVSMLTKLQRHNVNIDDMNNDKLRQRCLSESTTTESTTTVNVEDKENKTKIGLFMDRSITKNDSEEKDLVRTLKINMDKVMKFINNQQKFLDKNTQSVPEPNKKMIQPTQEHIHRSIHIENIMTTTRPTTKRGNIKSLIEYDKGKPILESVIKFWQMYMKDNETNDDTRNVETVTEIISIPKIVTNRIIYQESTSSTLPQNIESNANSHYREKEYRENENNANNYYENKYTDHENNLNNYYPEYMYKDPENNESKEIEHISRMLTNYISRKRTKSETSQAKPENKRNVKLSRVSQQLNSFLANNALLNNVKEEINVRDREHIHIQGKKSFPDNTNNLKITQDEKMCPNKPHNEKEKTMLKPINSANDNQEFDNIKYYTTTEESIKYINDQLKEVDIKSTPDKVFFHQYEKSTMKNYPIELIAYNQQKETNKQIKSDKVYNDSYENAVTKEAPIKHLAPEDLKRIAENVKEIVLKDLRRETTTASTKTSVTTTTNIILTTTTEQTPTTVTDITTTTAKKLDLNKVQKATEAIEKFIDLFEQFNSFREKTVVSPGAKYKMTERVEGKKGYTVPLKVMYETPPKNLYGTRTSAKQRSPAIFNPYFHKSSMHTHKQNTINIITPLHHTPVININQMRSAPILIQTDLNEIPPLVIPLKQPMLMNHNIIVTSEFPFEINRADRQRWQYMSQYGRNPDTKEDIQNRKDSLTAYSNTDFNKHITEFGRPKKREGFDSKFENWEEKLHGHKRNDSSRIKYREKPSYKEEHDERNYHDLYNVQPYHLEHNRVHPQDHNIKGFHERLENLDDWPEHKLYEHIDNEESKIASRQQLPLNDMKIGSKYDDSHFRNFLKTQQKVNDMLESILGTKARHGGPRSVESI